MISRIQFKAFGTTASEVEEWLRALATRVNHDFELDGCFGEQVIERDLAEPDGSRYAFHGRLLLLPNVSEDARQLSSVRPSFRVSAMPNSTISPD